MKQDHSNEANAQQSEMAPVIEIEAAFELFEKRGQSDSALDALKLAKKHSDFRKIERDKNHRMRDEDKRLDRMVELQREFSQIHNESLLIFLSRGLHAPNKEAKVVAKAGQSELDDLTKQLVHMQERVEKEADTGVLPSDKLNSDCNSNEFSLILRYNIALTFLCSGNANAGQRVLEPIYSSMANQVGLEDKADESECNVSPLLSIYCDIAFLLLECIVHASSGTCVLANTKIASPIDSLFQWISAYLKKIEKELYDIESQDLSSTTALHELKFRMHLYKSRILFLKGNTSDTQRLSKKEMKSAMEILQHKLRRPESIGGVAAPNASGSHNVALKMDKKYHQIALYLKANSEHLKGNTKKALKLCAEASSAGEDLEGATPGQTLEGLLEASMHYNNLAIIHQSAGKVHIALHYYVRALSLIQKINHTYSSFADIDGQGFASPIPLAEILHNASLCAAQGGKWESAYECMAKCTLVSPEVFARRARCWLHIAEACIGMHTSKREDEGNDFSFSFNGGKGSNTLSLSRSTNQTSPFFGSNMANASMPSLADSGLGSSTDILLTKARPLDRALQCLHMSLQRSQTGYNSTSSFRSSENEDGGESEDDNDCVEGILTCLAYVHLEMRDPCSALQAALDVLNRPVPPEMSAKDSTIDAPAKSVDGNADEATDNLAARQRFKKSTFYYRREKVRMYACECLCILGQSEQALDVLLHGADANDAHGERGKPDGDWSEILEIMSQRLSLSTDATSGISSRSDTSATIAASVSICGVHASAGNLDSAHALASAAMQQTVRSSVDDLGASLILPQDSMPDQTLKLGMSSSSSYNSTAKRSLLYCLLKKGESANALELLQYAR